jgi:23S rRNA pseudouridine1911/1915/1917 synthase
MESAKVRETRGSTVRQNSASPPDAARLASTLPILTGLPPGADVRRTRPGADGSTVTHLRQQGSGTASSLVSWRLAARSASGTGDAAAWTAPRPASAVSDATRTARPLSAGPHPGAAPRTAGAVAFSPRESQPPRVPSLAASSPQPDPPAAVQPPSATTKGGVRCPLMSLRAPPAPPPDQRLHVPAERAPVPLDRALRALLPDQTWSRARALITTGKVSVNGTVVTEPRALVAGGAVLEIRTNAPRPGTQRRLDAAVLVHVDTDCVVVNKPAGISTVPFDAGERGTLDQLVRALLNRSRQRRTTGDLGVVHRLDKDTTGLLVFTRTLAAKRDLQQQFRVHSVERRYLALAHGRVTARTLSSRLVADRGDGIRGSTENPRLGQLATTHVRPLEHFDDATLIECRLETGRTHQIRIHLSESGHPLLGERVYCRGLRLRELGAPRTMLHAATLGFDHPRTHVRVHFEAPLPADLLAVVEDLRAHRGP